MHPGLSFILEFQARRMFALVAVASSYPASVSCRLAVVPRFAWMQTSLTPSPLGYERVSWRQTDPALRRPSRHIFFSLLFYWAAVGRLGTRRNRKKKRLPLPLPRRTMPRKPFWRRTEWMSYIILGPSCCSAAAVASALARRRGVPVISWACSADYLLDKARGWHYRSSCGTKLVEDFFLRKRETRATTESHRTRQSKIDTYPYLCRGCVCFPAGLNFLVLCQRGVSCIVANSYHGGT